MEDKVRVFEIADESGATSNEVIKKAAELSIILKSPQSTVSFEQAEAITEYILTGESKLLAKKEQPAKTKPPKSKTVKKEQPSEQTAQKQGAKQPTTKKVEETKSESAQKASDKPSKAAIIAKDIEEDESEDLSQKVTLKKRGLTIVKKKRPNESDTQEQSIAQKKKKMASMSELFSSASDTQEESSSFSTKVKPKVKPKKQAARAHQHGTKLEVARDREDFVSSDDTLVGEEVVLLDMGLMETSKFLQEAPKQKASTVRSTKASAFGNAPRGLTRGKKKKKYKKVVQELEITDVTIPEECRVYEFAEKIGKSTGDVIGKLFMLGMMVTKNDFLGADELEILGDEYGINITVKDELEDVNYIEDYHDDEIDTKNYTERPPVVTIMGHVDHGKTSLLDKIRSSRVAAGEAGGITQHIAAYTIEKNGKNITFVDTPGHEAFSAMRRRGASITDIVIIVVAADDGVMPQTVESIKSAQESGAPIIVAMNKIDKESANPDMVKAGLAEHGLTPIEWGGETEIIGVSAKTGEGIEDLLETILLQSELLELEADPDALAKCTVIEASQVKGRGAVATVIVQNGTLKVGDNIVADTTYGRVKALLDDQGNSVKELGLSFTGQVVGLNEVPGTGTTMVAQKTAAEAKDIATKRAEHARQKELSKSTKVSLDEMAGLIAEGKIKALPVILKADVGGTLEAIKASLELIKNDEVKVKIVGSGVGGITEADIALAGASDDCIILGFNVRPTGAVKNKAKADGIEIKTYSIIYDLIDDVKATLSGMMSTVVIEENTGQANVLDTFVIPRVGTVAGCKVTDGKVVRGGLARIIRDGVVVYTGAIKSLKRFKDDVKEVANGYECGIIFENYNDIKVNDYIETFIEHKEEQTID
ncbi:MAG: translation initiation factor IF-2 [Campylobacterales bacterium]|nr:translation initiation factor IF-2 [Campylobacterales bacterium]